MAAFSPRVFPIKNIREDAIKTEIVLIIKPLRVPNKIIETAIKVAEFPGIKHNSVDDNTNKAINAIQPKAPHFEINSLIPSIFATPKALRVKYIPTLKAATHNNRRDIFIHFFIFNLYRLKTPTFEICFLGCVYTYL